MRFHLSREPLKCAGAVVSCKPDLFFIWKSFTHNALPSMEMWTNMIPLFLGFLLLLCQRIAQTYCFFKTSALKFTDIKIWCETSETVMCKNFFSWWELIVLKVNLCKFLNISFKGKNRQQNKNKILLFRSSVLSL